VKPNGSSAYITRQDLVTSHLSYQNEKRKHSRSFNLR